MAVNEKDQGQKSERIGIRTSEWQRELLLAASKAEGSTITDFVLKHATRAAEDVLADRRVFMLPPTRWEAFVDALDRPERELPRLRKLMDIPTILDEM